MARVIAGRLALVTGGARGIGRATAGALLDEGVRVVIADRDGAVAEATARTLSRPGHTIEALTLDVTVAGAFAEAVRVVEARHGPLDLLVNNAGLMCLGGFLDQDPALDERQIAVNFAGVVAGMRAVLPGMVARRSGHVVNIASVAGKVGVPYAAVYAGTKHAVVGLTEAVRHELVDSGVTLSYVLPGIVRTELSSGSGRLAWPPPVEPEDVALAVVRAWRTGAVDVFVPGFTRLSAVLPALLPRRVVERVGRWFGIDRVFATVDPAARREYLARVAVQLRPDDRTG